MGVEVKIVPDNAALARAADAVLLGVEPVGGTVEGRGVLLTAMRVLRGRSEVACAVTETRRTG